jgi:hypothetical protein
MRDLFSGMNLIQGLFFWMMIIVVAALAILALTAAIALWTIVRIFRMAAAHVSHRAPVLAGAPTESNPAVVSFHNRNDVRIVAVTGGAAIVGITSWFNDTPSLLLVGAAIAVVGFALTTRPSDPGKETSSYALRGAAILGAIVAVMAVFNLITSAPVSVAVKEAPAYGVATQIEDVWSTVECFDGTERILPNPEPTFTFSSDLITRVGSCTMSESHKNHDPEVVYFFEAASAEDLDEWLLSGDLHAPKNLERDVDVYRDGAVALASTDGGSHGDLQNNGYDELDLE